MKRNHLKTLAALACAALLGLTTLGCDSDGNLISNGGGGGGGGGGNGGGTMTAMVDGVAWEADEVQATFDSGVLAMGGAQFPGGSANMQINITVPFAATGMSSLTPPSVAIYSNATSANVEDIESYSAVAVGTINIMTLDENGASGTFSFTGVQQLPVGQMGTVEITNGEFDLTF